MSLLFEAELVPVSCIKDFIYFTSSFYLSTIYQQYVSWYSA